MIKFIELEGTFEFKWEYSYTERDYGWSGSERHEYTYTHCIYAKLKGTELIDWLQTYGVTPDVMFKNQNPYGYKQDDGEVIPIYDLNKFAEEWATNHQDEIKKNPWTVVGMNGGYVLMSNGSKENTVELGSASVVNLEMNNSNTTSVRNNPNINVRAHASLI